MSDTIPATTDELRQAFERARLLHLRGMTFDQAQAIPMLRWALERSALSYRKSHHLPSQPRLI